MQDLKELGLFYVSGLWQRRWSVLLVAWLIAIAGWAYVAKLPPRYTAEATIFVNTESILGPLMRGLAVTPDVDRQVRVMRDTLLGRPNLEQLIRETDLAIVHDVESDIDREIMVESLRQNIRMSTRNDSLFRVYYTDTDAVLAQEVVGRIIEIFVEQNIGNTQKDVEEAQQFIDRQIEDYERQLREAEIAVAEFRRQHARELGGSVRTERELAEAEGILRRLESELASAQWQRDQLRLQLASTPPTVSMSAAIGGPSAEELRLQELRQQLDDLLLVFTESHPDVGILRSRIAQAEAALAAGQDGATGTQVPNPIFDQLDSELRTTEQRVAELERRIDVTRFEISEFQARANEVPEVEAELIRLTRDYEIMVTRYQDLVDRRETALLAQRMDTETRNIEFRLIEPPVVPQQPSGPPYALLSLGVLIVAGGGGVAFGVLRMLLQSEIVTLRQMREEFDLPILGAVSLVQSTAQTRLRAVEVASYLVVGGLLLGCAGGVFYIYSSNPVPPQLTFDMGDVRTLVTDQLARLR